MPELLTPAQMAKADRLTIDGGIPGIELMENAGLAVVEVLKKQFPEFQNILIVCGTGNNGGDGFVTARRLVDEGRRIKVFICGDIKSISGDAERALAKLDKSILIGGYPNFTEPDVIVDALLGAGLDREVKGTFASIIKAINESGKPVLSIDLPSGVDGKTGQIQGCAVKAHCTVTFFRYKLGHILMPGRHYCAKRFLQQIGIKAETLKQTGISGIQNVPANWRKHYPVPSLAGHKYHRGHTLVISGPMTSTGAARLLALAALRSGSGLVTVASPVDALVVNAIHLTSVMLQKADSPHDVQEILADQRFNCVALGPGLPADKHTASMVIRVLEMQRKTILDAGGLAAFSANPERLFEAIKTSNKPVIITPHGGEFGRLFPDLGVHGSKVERARAAADKSGAVVILKGPDTVVATPGGEVSVSDNSPPWLATAGSGDVLAGIVAGLVAQGMPAFVAANAAIWLHGDAANRLGFGMISSDLDEGLRQSIKSLLIPSDINS